METVFTIQDAMGHILLNRPQVLNALSAAQMVELAQGLARFAADPAIRVVVVEGAGERAFCAGGDIRAVWDARQAGRDGDSFVLFRDEYRLDRLIHHYAKDYVCLLDGVVMGGGAGISVNGRFRVATERTLFAMPETGIGFFPDVGASHFLNRCPGQVGLYLGLTGTRLGPADMVWTGLATHYVPSARLEDLKVALANGDAARVLAAFHQDAGPSVLAERARAIDAVFDAPDLETIRANLRACAQDWAAEALAAMERASPTALAVTFRQLVGGRGLDFDAAIQREYRIACTFLEGSEFHEGIRAQVVDKDRRPRWAAAITPDLVEQYFRHRGEGELVFT